MHYEISRKRRIRNNVFECACGNEYTSKDKLVDHIEKSNIHHCNNCGMKKSNKKCEYCGYDKNATGSQNPFIGWDNKGKCTECGDFFLDCSCFDEDLYDDIN